MDIEQRMAWNRRYGFEYEPGVLEQLLAGYGRARSELEQALKQVGGPKKGEDPQRGRQCE